MQGGNAEGEGEDLGEDPVVPVAWDRGRAEGSECVCPEVRCEPFQVEQTGVGGWGGAEFKGGSASKQGRAPAGTKSK